MIKKFLDRLMKMQQMKKKILAIRTNKMLNKSMKCH